MATTVERRVEDDRHDVVLGITGEHAKALLTDLARAVFTDPSLVVELGVLGHNRRSEQRRAIAVEALLDSIAVRQALQVVLDGDEADELVAALDDAAIEPARCRSCRSYAVPSADDCARHLADGDDLERAS